MDEPMSNLTTAQNIAKSVAQERDTRNRSQNNDKIHPMQCCSQPDLLIMYAAKKTRVTMTRAPGIALCS